MTMNNENQLHVIYLSIYLISYHTDMTAKKVLIKGPGWNLGTSRALPPLFLLKPASKRGALGQPMFQIENYQSSCLPSSLSALTVWILPQGMAI